MTTEHSMSARLGRWIATTLARDRRRGGLTVLGVAVLAVACLVMARGVRVNANLEILLDREAPAITALDELRDRQGSTDPLFIAIKSTDEAANLEMIQEVADELRTWPEVLAVEWDRDYTPIRDRALYFLEVDELEKLRDDLLAERRKAVAREMAMGVGEGGAPDLEQVVVGDDWDAPIDDEEEDEDEQENPDAPAREKQGRKKDIAQLLEEQRQRIASDGRVPEEILERAWPREDEKGRMVWEERVAAPLRNLNARGEYTHLVKARLEGSPTDLDYARKIFKRARALIDRIDPASRVPGALGKVGGAWNVSREASSILKDLRAASGLSAALVVGVLLIGFRGLRVLPIVLAPVAISVFVGLAMARVMFGELSVLTAFLFAVLLGIGVDFAVHLYAARERQGPTPDWSAVLEKHLRPLAASMITTVGSFLVLATADFRGFQEFGLIAAVGVAVSFLVALALVPAMDVLLGPVRARAQRPSVSAGVVPGPVAAGSRWILVAILAAVAMAGAGRVEFETNLRNLRAPKSESEEGVSYRKPLGEKRSGTPAVILADEPDQLRTAVEALRADMNTVLIPADHPHTDAGKPWIRDVMALYLYMPPDQGAKQDLVREIGEHAGFLLAALPDLDRDDPARQYETHLETLKNLAAHAPIQEEELPSWARLPFLEKDGTTDLLGLLYVRVPEYDLGEIQKVASRFRNKVEGTGVRGASSRFILADLTTAVQEDARRLPPIALLVILVLIAADLRKAVPTAVCFVTLCLGLGVTFGVMGLLPIRINFYNMVVMPSVIGLGIDASIHLWHARSHGVSTVLTTGKAALVSSLTTAGGFAGLLVAQHKGLQSIGTLGVVATLCTVVAALVVLGRLRPDDEPGADQSAGVS